MSDGSTRRFSPQWVVIAVLMGLIVAGLGFFGWAVVDKTRTDAAEEEVAELAAQRQDLRDLAVEFVTQLHTYGPDDLTGDRLTGYQERVAQLMTAKFRAAFEKNLPITEATVAQFDTRSRSKATASGVAVMKDDSAEVLVGGWVLLAYQHPEKPEQEIVGDQQPVRYRVVLRRVEGEWLVDRLCNVEDVTGANCLGEDVAPDGAPTDLPTEGGSEAPTEGGSAEGGDTAAPEGGSDSPAESPAATDETSEEAP